MKWHDAESPTVASALLVGTTLAAVAVGLAGCSGSYSKFAITPLQWEMGWSPPAIRADLSSQVLPPPNPARESSRIVPPAQAWK